MWCAADNYNYMRRICAKGFLHSDFNQAVIDKILIFLRNHPKFHIFTKNGTFKSIIGIFRTTASFL